jgi:hypothetical protein
MRRTIRNIYVAAVRPYGRTRQGICGGECGYGQREATAWTLKAFKYYYIPSPPLGLAGIVVEPTENLHRLQDELITAVAPYTVKTGTPAAFFSDEGGRDIQKSLIAYVANFVTDAAGKRFNPHVTIGVGTEAYLNKMLAEPFASFTFSPAGASVYQLGSFGTARKELSGVDADTLRTAAESLRLHCGHIFRETRKC